jgi:hypothetical protein
MLLLSSEERSDAKDTTESNDETAASKTFDDREFEFTREYQQQIGRGRGGSRGGRGSRGLGRSSRGGHSSVESRAASIASDAAEGAAGVGTVASRGRGRGRGRGGSADAAVTDTTPAATRKPVPLELKRDMLVVIGHMQDVRRNLSTFDAWKKSDPLRVMWFRRGLHGKDVGNIKSFKSPLREL